METKKMKLLKEGDAKFYIKSFSDKDYSGKKFISPKNNKPYLKACFRVTDSEGNSENLYKVFSVEFKKDLIKLLKCIGKSYLSEYLSLPDFNWDDLEDESGMCRIETKTTEKYGDISSIESFIKKDMGDIEFKKDYQDKTVESTKERKSPSEHLKSSSLNNTMAAPTFGTADSDLDDLPF